MSRILVTGATGQVASALRERAGTGADVDLSCVGRPELDLAQPRSIEHALDSWRPDIIINAGAYTNVDKAEDEPDEAMKINALAPGILGRAARRTGARIIHLSTDYVFDGSKADPYLETDAVGPRCVYGRSKLEGEEALRESGADHIVFRTAWVYSPFSRNFVRTMLALAGQRQQLNVVNDQIGNPTSALDIADAILTLVKRWRTEPHLGLGEIYHCAGTGSASWCEFARSTFEYSRDLGGPYAEALPITTDQWPSKAVRPHYSMLDCSKLERDFDWRAPHWRDSVRDVVNRLVAER